MACYVSAAPIEIKILEYFASIDIPILELFGQSECSGPHCTNSPSGWKIGSIGRPLEGTISKLDPNNGELIYSGRHVFAGYMSMEDKTKETVDSDGFLHSGDVVSVSTQLYALLTFIVQCFRWHNLIISTSFIKMLHLALFYNNGIRLMTVSRTECPTLVSCTLLAESRRSSSLLEGRTFLLCSSRIR